MKLELKIKINFWNIFIHDHDDGAAIDLFEDQLKEMLSDFNMKAGFPFTDPRIVSPDSSGLDRWVFCVVANGQTKHYSKRCNSESEVKKLLPNKIHAWIDEMNKTKITIG